MSSEANFVEQMVLVERPFRDASIRFSPVIAAHPDRVFISSVQKELENERIGAQEILWTDPFLKNHCDPVLYEFEPASPRDATKKQGETTCLK
jgi:hypothetical protein